MRKSLGVIVLFILGWISPAQAQFVAEITDGVLVVKEAVKEAPNSILIKTGTNSLNISVPVICDQSNQSDTFGQISYEVDCNTRSIRIWSTAQESQKKQLYYCKTTKKHQDKECKVGAAPSSSYKNITEIPSPYFQYTKSERVPNKKSNRYLLIDATPTAALRENVTLYKKHGKEEKKKKKGRSKKNSTPSKVSSSKSTVEDANNIAFDHNFEPANSIHVNASLAIYLKNFDLKSIERLSFEIEAGNYSYEKSIENPYNTDTDSSSSEESDEENNSRIVSTTVQTQTLIVHLETVLGLLNSSGRYLNYQDLLSIEKYKNELQETLKKHSAAEQTAIRASEVWLKVLSWRPEYISLTPFALQNCECDEVEIVMTKREKDQEEEKRTISRLRTTGGMAIDVGGMVFFTDLKNNEVYTETVEVNGGTSELRAKLNEEDQLSIGLGVQNEVSFRTGSLFRPTIGVGFFVPLEETLSPIITLGLGFSLSSSKVKVSFSGGLAYGKIAAIKEQYRDRDLSSTMDLTNDKLTDMVWQRGSYFGVGIRYYLN